VVRRKKIKGKEIMAKEVQKQEKKDVVLTDAGMFEGESSGFEGASNSTFKTPFLKVLQALSPEVKKSDPKFIATAQQGQFCNSATQQLYDSIEIVVLKLEHSLITWKPNRGGFVGRTNKAQESSVVVQKDGVKKWDEGGNSVMDTIEFFCLNINNPSDIFILSLSAASFKHARTFATRLRLLQADGKLVNVTWAGVWKISTVEESNEKGSWYTIGATPEFVRFITKEEKDNFISPARKLLESAEIDYSAIESESPVSEGTPDEPSF
jgi:hypothetical protein